MIGRSLILLAASLSLAACGATGHVASAGSAPAQPSAQAPTTSPTQASIDDKAIILSFQALGVAASAADALIATGRITPGSPAALRLADNLQAAKSWLNAASAAQRTGLPEEYEGAIVQASAAISAVQAAISAFKGN